MLTVAEVYSWHCATESAITPHLPRLRTLAAGLELAVEFGVKRGASSSALLMGAKRVISFDLVETSQARTLKSVAGERWDYRLEDSRAAAIPPCDMIFVDSLHTFEQVHDELGHAGKVRPGGYLVFHDVSTFGEVGALGETGKQKWTYTAGRGSVPINCLGIRPAIDALMIRDPSWRIVARYNDSHGLLVLKRFES